MKDPGCAGLTGDRLGDSDQWVPQTARKSGDVMAETTAILLAERRGVKGQQRPDGSVEGSLK